MRAWSTTLRGPVRRQTIIRAVLGLVLVVALVWALPVRRPGESGGRHHAPEQELDAFERAGVVELKDGQRGPAFRLAKFDGGTATLDQWRDKLVILNFWATWCQPCTLEMPALEALWTRFRDRGLVVVGISVDRGAPRAILEPYLDNLRLTFPIVLDPDLETAGKWRVTALPATFIVKPGGDVVGFAVGPREWNSPEMVALLEPMLPGAGTNHRHR
ncbi:MAG: TlpA family protein disulfide reductase [Candidatus Rokubacteria bacterium]|nr:TlpA family protein disulfide reductase [Candidatus Rokubacteria bacterium]